MYRIAKSLSSNKSVNVTRHSTRLPHIVCLTQHIVMHTEILVLPLRDFLNSHASVQSADGYIMSRKRC